MGIGELLDAVTQHLGEGDPIREANANSFENLDAVADESIKPDPPPRELRLAIVGRPNVGKSSLLNGLLGRERVIVSPLAGTTFSRITKTARCPNSGECRLRTSSKC